MLCQGANDTAPFDVLIPLLLGEHPADEGLSFSSFLLSLIEILFVEHRRKRTEWGDLKANPSKLLGKYFDAFVYVAKWETHEFYIRLAGIGRHKSLKTMVTGESVRARKTARFVIVEFGSESEWDGEDDGTGWMASLFLVVFLPDSSRRSVYDRRLTPPALHLY